MKSIQLSFILFSILILFLSISQAVNEEEIDIDKPASTKVHNFVDGQKIPIFVNTIGPYWNPSETYRYYSLPFCKPEGENEQKIKQTFGQTIRGDRLEFSPYEISFKGILLNNRVK